MGLSSLMLPAASAASSGGWPAPGSGVVTAETGSVTRMRTSFIAGDYVVMATETTPPRVVMLRRSDLARVGTLTLTGELAVRASVTDGVFGYFPTIASPTRIVKVRLADLTVEDSLTLDDGEDYVIAAITDGTYGYFASYTTPSVVVKVRLSDLTRISAEPLSVGRVITATHDGTHAYLGTYTSDQTAPGAISKIRLSDLGEVAARSLGSTGPRSWLRPESIIVHRGVGYCVLDAIPGRIVRFAPSDLTLEGQLDLASGENQPGLMGHDGTHLLVGCYGIQTLNPGHAVRIVMSDLTRDGTLELDERQLATGAFDGTHSYFGDLGGTVVKVAMAGPTLVQRVSLLG